MARPCLVDAHCHLGDVAFDLDRDAVLERARQAGVCHVVVIGSTPEDSVRAAALARERAGPPSHGSAPASRPRPGCTPTKRRAGLPTPPPA